ncbi:MAG TPA: hypothetical protein VF529_14770 [Solirubrobacteraceae bacterium]
MRVCFLTSELPAPFAIAEYARRLDALVAVAPPAEGVDVAVACDWAACARLFEADAVRNAFWVDHFAYRRMGTWQAERFAAQLAYDLPVDFVAAAPWIAATLADLRPEARCLLVTSGPPPAAAAASSASAAGASPAPLRVHLARDEDRPAFDAMTEPATTTSLADADVVLMLSTVDGVLDVPLAGFRTGATAVVGPAHDATDLVVHGENGFVADADDTRGAARFLDLLARDRELLARLKEAAWARGESWPTWDDAAAEMESALRRILDEDPPAAARWPVRLMGDAIGGAAVFHQEHATLTAEIHRLRDAPRPNPLRKAAAALKRRAKARLAG